MSFVRFFARLRALFRGGKLDAEMSEEMRAHLECLTRENLGRGMSPDDACYAAQRAFGGVEQIKERCREQRVSLWLEQGLQDLHYAARSLWRNPGFTATVVLTLALAIGANAAIFSVVNAVLLEPLPYAHLDRLVNLRETRPVAGGTGRRVPVPVSPATFFDWRNGVSSFEQMAAVAPNEVTITGDGEPEQLPSASVSAEVFPMFGVTPLLGRQFRPEDNRPGAEPVVILSHAFWQRRFGGDAAVVGRPITLDGRPSTIIGVLPAWFDDAAAAGISLRSRPAIWAALSLVEAGAPRSIPAWDVHARLKPGATIAAAQSEVSAVMQRLAREFPATNAARDAQVESLVDRVVGSVRSNLWILFAAVALVLLIACANVANLLLARASLRGAETAMRAALGASRSRLLRQFLTESLLLSLAGCAVGLVAVAVSFDAFIAFLPKLPRAEHIAVDGRVLAFTILVSLLTGLAFGLLPAWHGARTDLQATIKTGGRSGQGGSGAARVRSVLIVAQVALSVVLLVGAGLLLKSFAVLTGVDPGFNPHNVLTLRVSLNGDKYRGGVVQSAFFDRLAQQVQAVPGVESAALVFPLPFSGPIQNSPFSVVGRGTNPADELSTELNIISPDYFRALGIRVTQGRVFTGRDTEGSPPVAMINETLARRIWPDENPIGKRLTLGRGRAATIEREVVGVFADIKQRELDSDRLLQICVPHAQIQTRTLYLAVRGRVDASTLLAPVRAQLRALDPDLPIVDLALWSERLHGS
ncbi:MAG TPA: ABC transporter permease, partial [Opitutaceae bacterium]|nr:ABC transporter permease [Opitutaceae bacterium]